jgi:hypothetical protein
MSRDPEHESHAGALSTGVTRGMWGLPLRESPGSCWAEEDDSAIRPARHRKSPLVEAVGLTHEEAGKVYNTRRQHGSYERETRLATQSSDGYLFRLTRGLVGCEKGRTLTTCNALM